MEEIVVPYQQLLDDTANTSSQIKKRLNKITKVQKNKQNKEEELSDLNSENLSTEEEKEYEEEVDDENESNSEEDTNEIDENKANTYSLEVLCKDNNDEEDSSILNDPFHVHFEKNLDEKLVEKLKVNLKDRAKLNECEHRFHWSSLNDLTYVSPLDETKVSLEENKELKTHAIKQRIIERLKEANGSQDLDKFQTETLNIISTYADFYNPNVDIKMDTKNKFTYAIHALNHVLKTRSRIIAHNDKIKQSKSNIDIEYRDQGLTRPKVLIVVPFRKFALKLVNIFISLIMRKSEEFVSNKKRFHDAFGPPGEEDNFETNKDSHEEHNEASEKEKKFDDFDFLFSGNNEDHCNNISC
jgi:U3 small nucleolar RNA-associated protein 25